MVACHDLNSEVSRDVATLVDLLRYRAVHQPRKLAFTFLKDGETESSSLTYQELDRQARAIAAALQCYGWGGERSLLLFPPGLEFIAAFFGCLYASVVAVPAYPPRPNQSMSRIQAIVASSQVMVALTTTSLLANIEGQLTQNPELAGLRWLCTDNLNSDLASDWQEPALCGSTLAFLQYTSGSTGRPKGVMVSHDNILHNERIIHKAFDHTEQSSVVGWLPLFHDMGLIGNMLQPLYSGIPCILMSPVAFLQRPWRWLQAISRYKATTSGGPNFAYDLCVSKITNHERATLDLSSWSVAFNGAEPIRAETLERFARTFGPCGFLRSAFYPCYGMAETTLFVSGGLKTAPPVVYPVQGAALEQNQVLRAASEQKDTRKLVGLGTTWLDQKIAIVDPESLTLFASDQVGEIWVSGLSVAQGYWNRPEETAHTFQAYLADTGEGPFLRTGDLGFLHSGELFVTGRIKDMIIIRGRNHYPQDIELTVEQSHPALRVGCGAAFSVEVEGCERLVVVAEVERSYLRRLVVDEVVGVIRKAVSEQHELQVYAVLLLKTGSIPKTSSGKIQRYACRAGFLDKSLDVVGDWIENPHSLVDEQQLQAQAESLRHQLLTSGEQQPFSDENESDFVSRRREAASRQRSLKSRPTEEAIQAWIVSHLAVYLKMQPDEIDIEETFACYGLDSSVAVSLTGELASVLGCELEPTLFWEYPSIAELAVHLATECQLSQSACQASA